MPLPIMLAHRLARRLRRGAQGGRPAVPAPGREGAGHGPLRGGRARPHSGRSRSSACSSRRSTATGSTSETLLKPDLVEHVIEPILPHDLYDEQRLERHGLRLRQPDRQVRHRRADGRHRPHRPQDHRRHIRRRSPARRRRLLGQGPDQGRPLGRVRGALRGEERRRRRARRALPAAGRVRDRRRAPDVDPRRHASAPRRSRSPTDRGARPRALRPPSGRDPPRPRPAPADLREDRRLRPLRPRRPRLHVGAHRQGRRAARGRGLSAPATV